MAKLGEGAEASVLEPLDGDMRARSRTTTDQQRVRGSEQLLHHCEKLEILHQPVALDMLQRHVESTGRMTCQKFGFAPDIDVSIPSS